MRLIRKSLAGVPVLNEEAGLLKATEACRLPDHHGAGRSATSRSGAAGRRCPSPAHVSEVKNLTLPAYVKSLVRVNVHRLYYCY